MFLPSVKIWHALPMFTNSVNPVAFLIIRKIASWNLLCYPKVRDNRGFSRGANVDNDHPILKNRLKWLDIEKKSTTVGRMLDGRFDWKKLSKYWLVQSNYAESQPMVVYQDGHAKKIY